MKFETAFNCGDKGWVWDGAFVRQVTIGQIRIQYTNSKGCSDWDFRGNAKCVDGNGKTNYGAIGEEYTEAYMCAETGVGSGTLYTLGEHIFLTEEECAAYNKVRLEELEKEKEKARIERLVYKKQRMISLESELNMLKRELEKV